VGKRIRLSITASNVAGSTQEFSLTSRVVAKKAPTSKPAAGRKINGTAKADNLKGTAGADTIRAGAGNDRVNPGKGRDTVFGGAGNDNIQAVDKTRDVIDCGTGRDTVVADKVDVLKGCESVKRR
jgi:Ca2+-binding RTX toxin-like protein